ncbi:hypothetical protein BRADI_1g73950v3 [Brachypodium distachyon]|uniref:Uncharacterized protein n=1 Tax=Brachypodium distachyon TaxID=15368 RepID=I1H9B9_BRADI|nr:hypothetical protein BRADI_1g73950v3 [Brachypodium distachyon]
MAALLFQRVLLAVLLVCFAYAVAFFSFSGGGGRFDPSHAVHGVPVQGFLSAAECDHLVALAEGMLQKSTVVDGKSVMSEVRTSIALAI